MRTPTLVTVAAAALLSLSASTTQAAKPEPHKDAVCTKYQKFDQFGNRSGNALGHADELCRNKAKKGFLESDWLVAVLRGKEDPKGYYPFFKDVFHTLKPEKQKRSRCVAAYCKNDVYEAAVAVGTPGVKEMLLAQITPERLKDLNCGDKKFMYNALWYLGDKSAVDTMIKGYNNLLCTNSHFNFTAPNFHLWGLSEAQYGAIEKICVDQIFSEKIRNAKESFKACQIFLTKRGKVNEDGLEFIKMKADANDEGRRALAILNTKKSKKKLAKWLADQESEKPVMKKGKATKKKRKVWRAGRPEALFAAAALAGLKDKNAQAALKYWLGFSGTELNNRQGFEGIFLMVAPFLPAAQQAKMRKTLEKAFATGLKAMKKNDALEESLRRAAYGLAQMGSNKGLQLILDGLDSDNSGTRKEVALAIGGTMNLMGGRNVGSGALKFGAGGLSKAEGDKLVTALAKRAKFEKGRNRVPFVRAVLSIKGIMKANGL